MAARAFPARLPLGRRHLGAADRGRARRGRARRVDLGPLRRDPRAASPTARDAARRLRPLPPLARGRRADALARASAPTASRSPGRASCPRGAAPSNAAGLDFYDALVDALLEAGIRPFVTLYHWDLPQALQDARRLGRRATPSTAFVDYADAVSRRLGDRVRHWVTHNEPWCIAHLGHEQGEHAPGHRDPAEALRVAHHLLLSHGRAVDGAAPERAGRARSASCSSSRPSHPATRRRGRPRRRAPVRRHRSTAGTSIRCSAGATRRTSSPTACGSGHLPGAELPFVRAGRPRARSRRRSTSSASTTTAAAVVRAGCRTGAPVGRADGARPSERTDMGWEVYPQGLHDLLVRARTATTRPPKIYVTENGAAYADAPGRRRAASPTRAASSSCAATSRRRSRAHRRRRAAAPATSPGRCSTTSSGAHGYAKRFGLFDVDFATQRRTPKDSALLVPRRRRRATRSTTPHPQIPSKEDSREPDPHDVRRPGAGSAARPRWRLRWRWRPPPRARRQPAPAAAREPCASSPTTRARGCRWTAGTSWCSA